MQDCDNPSPVPLISEQALIDQIVANRRLMLRLCVKLLGGIPNSYTLAEDLTQTVMLRAIRAVATFRQDCSLTSWLYRITTNVVLDAQRKQRREGGIPISLEAVYGSAENGDEHLVFEPQTPSPENQFAAQLDFESLAPVMDQLPVGQYVAFVLKAMQDLSFQEMSDQLFLPLSTVKTRYYSAIRYIRRHPSKKRGTMSTPTTASAIGHVKPAFDYHKPEWKFPEDGKVIALGYEHVGLVQSTYGNRVHFWSPVAIARKQDIPVNIAAIFIHHVVQRNSSEVRRLNDITRAFGVPLFTAANNNELGDELAKMLKGADLAVDPDLHSEPLASQLIDGADQRKPAQSPLPAQWIPKKGEVKEFFREHLNRAVGSKSEEAQRLRALIKERHNYEMSESAAYQQVLAVWSGSNEPREPSAHAGNSQYHAGSLKVEVDRLKTAFGVYCVEMNKQLDQIASHAAEVDQTNQRLTTELKGVQTEATGLRERLAQFDQLAAALEKIKKK